MSLPGASAGPALGPGPSTAHAASSDGTALTLPVLALAIGAFLFGAWLVWGGRGQTRRQAGWLRGLSTPSRFVLGLSVMLFAYHAAAWTSPDHWLPFRIPIERWYLLAFAGVAVAASLWIDRRQAADGA